MVIITNLKTGRSTSDSLLSFRTADVNFGESTVKLFHHIYTKKTYSCKPKLEQDGPNSQFDVAFGQVVPAFGIGGETTGIGLIGETGKMIEITGTNQEITQELFSLFNETIKVKGYWGKKFGVERGLYDVFFVAKIYR